MIGTHVRRALPWIALVVLAAGIAAVAIPDPIREVRPRTGGLTWRSFTWVERSWTAVSFEVGATDDVLVALRPTYQDAYAARDAALTQAMDAGNAEILTDALKKIKADVRAELKRLLTDEQYAAHGNSLRAQGEIGGHMPPREIGVLVGAVVRRERVAPTLLREATPDD